MPNAPTRSVNDAPVELQDAIREFFPPEQWDNAASIAWLESGWGVWAENDTTAGGSIACGTPLYVRDGMTVTAEHSIGWFQINACNFPWDARYWFNTRMNVGTAHMLWADRGWQPWQFSAKALGLL